MTDECNDHFLSFAKRSRTVQRRCEVERPICSMQFQKPQPLTPNLWGFSKIHNQNRSETSAAPFSFNNSVWTDMIPVSSTEPISGTVMGGPFASTQWVEDSGKLPTPAELMGRNRKVGRHRGAGGHQGSEMVQHKVAVVLNHIKDLKNRQSAIDQLKKETWWSCGTACKSNMTESEAVIGARVSQFEPSANHLSNLKWRPDSSSSFCLALYKQEVMFGSQEKEKVLNLLPGGNPMMSFVMATANRQEPSWS